MRLVRAEEGVPYDPPGHHGVEAVRLQELHHAADRASTGLRVAVSRYLPGSWVDLAPTAAETVYVVLAGELELTASDGQVVVLRPHDSVYLALGESRALRNTSGRDATLLVVLADQTSARPHQETP